MGTSKERQQTPAQEPETDDMLDRQYHEIGIAAVAAACRYLHKPDPAPLGSDENGQPN